MARGARARAGGRARARAAAGLIIYESGLGLGWR